jgi:hypothetical protein
MTLKVFEKIYPSHNNLYEQFDWQKELSLQELVNEAIIQQPFILKFTWWDVKDNFEMISQIPAKFYYLKRTDPFEMVASSYLAHISGIYHKGINESYTSLTNVVISIDFLEHFFDKTQPGGWNFMLEENNPMLPFIRYDVLEYNDNTTPADMYLQITGKKKNIEVNFRKLYKNKNDVISNAKFVKEWIKENV